MRLLRLVWPWLVIHEQGQAILRQAEMIESQAKVSRAVHEENRRLRTVQRRCPVCGRLS